MKVLDEIMDDNRIFDCDLSEDKASMKVYECCDYYFERDLNKEQFGRLIAEMKELHAQMVDPCAPASKETK